MNFGFSEEQDFLRSTAREFLANECPSSVVRELMEDPRGYRPEMWKQMAELGWLGLLVPEEYGGAALRFVDLVVIQEEIGRANLPAPMLATLQGTLALLRAGNETQRKELLPQVASGDCILSLAITEVAGTEQAAHIETRALREAAGYRLTGTKLFVPDGQNADRIVVAARTGGAGEAGISLLLVDPAAGGVEIEPLESMDRTRRLAEVRFEGAPA